MKYLIAFLCFSQFAFLPLMNCQTPLNDPHWELVKVENFNVVDESLNGWTVKYLFDQYGGFQVFLPENKSVTNGILNLTTTYDPYLCPPFATVMGLCERQFLTNQPYNFKSAMLVSNFDVFYGYIEARIDFAYTNGIWPAFWTVVSPNAISPVSACEIDIAEINSSGCPVNSTGSNIHHFYPNADVEVQFKKNGFLNSAGNWHKYAIEWSPSKIIWYVDDYPVRTTTNHGVNSPINLILSDGVSSNNLINIYSFPHTTKVDYVKIYKLKKDCENSLNCCFYNFANHINKVKSTITIGVGGCSNSLNVTDNVYLRATESVEINSNFDVPVGAQLYIDVNSCYN